MITGKRMQQGRSVHCVELYQQGSSVGANSLPFHLPYFVALLLASQCFNARGEQNLLQNSRQQSAPSDLKFRKNGASPATTINIDPTKIYKQFCLNRRATQVLSVSTKSVRF